MTVLSIHLPNESSLKAASKCHANVATNAGEIAGDSRHGFTTQPWR